MATPETEIRALLEKHAIWDEETQMWVSTRIRKIRSALAHKGYLLHAYTISHCPKTWNMNTTCFVFQLRLPKSLEEREELKKKFSKPGFKEEVKSDLTKVGYRQVAKQSANAIHALLLKAAMQNGMKGSELQAVKKFLASDFMTSLIQLGLGVGLTTMGPESEMMQKLAKELRVGGLDRGADVGIAKLMEMGPEMFSLLENVMGAMKETNTDMQTALVNLSQMQKFPKEIEELLEAEAEAEFEVEAEVTR